MRTTALAALLLTFTAAFAPADDNSADLVLKLLKEAGSATYSQKESYGGGIESMYLGFDKDSKPVIGIATRNTKTYKESMTLVAVVPHEGKFQIKTASIPDIESFHGKSKDLTMNALKDITGKVFSDENDARGMMDSITGATKYLEAIYLSCSIMASKVIKEMNDKPAWKTIPLSSE